MADGAQWFRAETGGGRFVEVLVSGAPEGLPLLCHYGTPAAATPRPTVEREAAARGLRVVSYSRPGYAESTARPGRNVASCVDEVRAVLDLLGIDEFVVIGWSGGGPHTLATVAQLPDRCLAAATIAGAAPSDAPGLDFVAGMGPENVEEFAAAVAGEQTLSAYLLKEAVALARIQVDGVIAALGGVASDVDRAAITGAFAESLATSLRRSVSKGIAGWRDDDLAYVKPWGFDPETIRRPVALWQGDQDLMVPVDHARWLGHHVPGAELHLVPGQGHLSLSELHLGAILDDLLRLAGRDPVAVPSTIT